MSQTDTITDAPTPTVIPTSGSGRRRAKAIARQGHLHELDVRWAFRLNRLPVHADAVSVCSCGRMAWLMPGGTAEDLEAFDRDNADHDSLCTLLDDVVPA